MMIGLKNTEEKIVEFLIVTGLSGAGKSLVVDALEDVGFYCVDNMPPMMILRFYRICLKSQEEFDKVAVVTDIRGGEPFRTLINDLEVLKVQENPFKILFINCGTHVLLNRFKETRRRHPLSDEYEGSVEAAIVAEKNMLEPAYKMADYLIDTTELSPTQLKNRVKDMFGDSGVTEQMVVRVMSFGFKYGPCRESDLTFDVRCFPNPYYVPELKTHTGLESCVREYVLGDESVRGFLTRLYDMVDYLLPLYKKEGKSELVIAVGCTGGKHRSVTIAENLGAYLLSKHNKVVISHRDIKK